MASNCEHVWKVLYKTDHIKTYVCEKCGDNCYEEGPFDAR